MSSLYEFVLALQQIQGGQGHSELLHNAARGAKNCDEIHLRCAKAILWSAHAVLASFGKICLSYHSTQFVTLFTSFYPSGSDHKKHENNILSYNTLITKLVQTTRMNFYQTVWS